MLHGSQQAAEIVVSVLTDGLRKPLAGLALVPESKSFGTGKIPCGNTDRTSARSQNLDGLKF